MIRAVRWYLSSFYAGRRSMIAKKPYNPILGECFRCSWGDPGISECAATGNQQSGSSVSSPQQQNKMLDKASCHKSVVHWAPVTDVTFLAEQVSHHPPVSAFYAEHIPSRMFVNGHIYTKSAFLGMSIAVHNIGQAKLTLMDHGEEYFYTFPSGYGRSILTCPWLELGGKVSVSCPQTDHIAHIEFKCKPFFSAEVHKIQGTISCPAHSAVSCENKAITIRLDGEWNGRVVARQPHNKSSNSSSQLQQQKGGVASSLFFDVQELPLATKRCLPLSQQDVNESRRVWRDVTWHLRQNSIEGATTAKSTLEHRQRQVAACRAKSKDPRLRVHTPAQFEAHGDDWVCMQSLDRRCQRNGVVHHDKENNR